MDKSKSKRIVTIILVIAAILGLASIGTAYYYYQIRDVTPDETSAAQGCGCYFVKTTDTVTSCVDADPKMAFEFRPGIVQDNGTCSAACDLRTAPETQSTANDSSSVIACKVSDFTLNPGCTDISIEDADGKRIPNSIDPDKKVTVKAKFSVPQSLATSDEDFYDGFSIIVNGSKTEIGITDAVKRGTGSDAEYTVSTDVTDYGGADTLTVQAFGSSVVGTEFTSSACLRELEINQAQAPSCSSLDITTVKDGTATKVDDLTIETAGLTDVNTLVAKFTLGTNDTVITTDDISSKFLDGTILLDQSFLYNSSNFTGANSFGVLNSETSKLDITVDLTANGTAIDSDACVVSEQIEADTPSDTPTDEEPTDEEPTDETGDTSAFTVTKAVNLQCVERASPDNVTTYTITVTNGDTAYEDISSVVDKLPLGFSYIDGSSEINGSAVTDTDFVTVEDVGSSQKITWQTDAGWSVNTNDTLTIKYQALVNEDALSGDNLNEVVITPVNTPVDPDSVRTEVSIEVAQSCTAPETAIDSTSAKLIIAVMIIIFGAAFYTTSTGSALSEKLAGSKATQGVYKGVQMAGWKLTNPRKYFEQKVIDKLDKRRKSNRS